MHQVSSLPPAILLLALHVSSFFFTEVCETAATLWDKEQVGDGKKGMMGEG